jgi:Heterokaryon incompatibility protein (HET)
MSAPFTYSPLSQGHIRVLQVKRVCSGTLYELHHKLLEDNLRFRAISYAWGSSALTHSINCNGKNLLVTSSVFELLSSTVISNLCDELPIWVDAICINQGDDGEKAHQVRQMGSLYSLAEEVILWLGPASSDSDLAMDTIWALSQKKALISRENDLQFATSKETLQNAGLANAGEEILYALGSFFCRSYFQRLWVVQEVVLAQRRQVVCGSKSILWGDFADATGAIGRLQVHQFGLIFPNGLCGGRGLLGIFEMSRALEIRRLQSAGAKLTFLLDIAGRKAVTDPRDRVYGILGMARSQVRESVKVDYSQQDPNALLRLYIDSGKACIEEDTALSLLYIISGRERNPGLPSWCPDLEAEPPQERRLGLHPVMKAGIRTKPQGEELPTAWFEPGDDDLYAPGCRVDIVNQVVDSTFCWSDIDRDGWDPSIEDATSNLIWQRECLALLEQTFTKQSELPFSYILTLCEGFLVGVEFEPHVIREAYNRNILLWEEAEKSLPHADTSQRVKTAAYQFHGRLMQNCLGRKFFSTNGSRVGIGPPETQAGDQVYILYGAGPLYLLRFGDYAIQILGNVYIHELMNLDETPEDAKEENEIVIIN